MPSNIPDRTLNYLQLNNTKLLNSPLLVFVKGSPADGWWWRPICKLSPYNSSRTNGGVNLAGSFGGYMSDTISHIDIAINNRQYGDSDPSPLRVVGTYKPHISTVSLPKRTIEVRKSGDDMIVYLRGSSYSFFDLRATMSRSLGSPESPEWLWDADEAALTEEPEGEVIWDLIKDMSPTPDMEELKTYLFGPRNNSYAAQLLNATQENPMDMNDYKRLGAYKIISQTQAQYVANTPLGLYGGFIFYVLNTDGIFRPEEEEEGGSVVQVAVRKDISFVRWYSAADGWSDWVRTDLNAIQAGTNITKTIDEQGRVVLSAAGSMTKEEILEVLGYTEIELSKTDANNNTVTVHVLGRVG